jgi:hypothetical protein
MSHHEIWSVPPGGVKRERVASYPESRWQWALKCAARLRRLGHRKVQVRQAQPTTPNKSD